MTKKNPHTKNVATYKKEVFEDTQPFLPSNGIGIKRMTDFLKETLGNASRYKNPLSIIERVTVSLKKDLIGVGEISQAFAFENRNSFDIPMHWQIIVNYLYRGGVLQSPHMFFDDIFNDEPKIYSVRLQGKAPVGLTDGGMELANGLYSRGVSLNKEEALSKTVGEFLERYPLILYKDAQLARASITDLKKEGSKFLNPLLVAPLADWQKKQNKKFQLDESSIFRWVKGVSLTENRSAFMPAQMVFWNYRNAENEPVVHQPITNGAGGMFTLEEAILSGLYELIQRDAFFIHWFNFISPPRIDISLSNNPEIKKLLEACSRYNLDVFVLDTTSDLKIPACVAVIIDRSGKGPAVSLGGGCGPEEDSNIVRSITEALGVRLWLRGQKNEYRLAGNYKPFSGYMSQLDRLTMWKDLGLLNKIDFLLKGPIKKPKASYDKIIEENTVFRKKKELEDLINVFKKKGLEYEIFFYKAKHKILDELGYNSVRVSVPALLPLYFNEACAPLGSRRIREVCVSLGYAPPQSINEFPHPFP